MDGAVLEYVTVLLQGIILPWLINVDRRLSRIEGYLRGLMGERDG